MSPDASRPQASINTAHTSASLHAREPSCTKGVLHGHCSSRSGRRPAGQLCAHIADGDGEGVYDRVTKRQPRNSLRRGRGQGAVLPGLPGSHSHLYLSHSTCGPGARPLPFSWLCGLGAACTPGLRAAFRASDAPCVTGGERPTSQSSPVVPASQSAVPEEQDVLNYTEVSVTEDQSPGHTPQGVSDSHGALDSHELCVRGCPSCPS